MNTKAFKGANVFMSRNLVPPELYDALHDALKLNGADVFPCSDPSRNSPDDFHVISSDLHEKFDVLRAKGCNLLGPQCVLSCAKERRPLPKLGYVCCLAMDGVKVLASGFGTGERERIGKLVMAMSGSFESRASFDVSFVIVKSVMAGKYKWAASTKKHIVTINWLNQCWIEHRVVPLETYRVPPFFGLTISVTRFPADERKEMEKLIIQNGGKYSAELTKNCTHLICEVAEGDKFKVAQRWGTISIVNRKWFDQSVARRVCLDEEAYPSQSSSLSVVSASRRKQMVKSGQDRNLRNSKSAMSSAVTESSLHALPSMGNDMEPDLDVALSQNISNVSSVDISASVKEGKEGSADLPQNEKELEGCIADDSEADDNDLYLSDCKIYLVGFNMSDSRTLLGMVRRGGGSRYMFCNERLTHIVVGAPSDIEKRELRGLAALGVIRIVKRNWLEDCDREKKEVPVVQKHLAHDILLPKDALPLSFKASIPGMSGSLPVDLATDLTSEAANAGTRMPMEEVRDDLVDTRRSGSLFVEEIRSSSQSKSFSAANSKYTSQQKIQPSASQHGKLSKVFAQKNFHFSLSFPKDKSDEVVQWISEGGGEVVDGHVTMGVDFIVECHGVIPRPSRSSQSAYVSTHWIKACLKEGCLLDVCSHILYSPLPCQIPLPGFERVRFCVSQYPDKERLLLRNLCYVLGVKFGDKLTKKVTHLLCKYANGPKYEAACKWGIHPVRCEWLYECVSKGEVVALDNFYPEEGAHDPQAGVCTVTQNPTQAAKFISMDNSTQVSGESQDLRKATCERSRKRLKLLEPDSRLNQVKNELSVTESHKTIKEVGHPDVATAIEDLLEETSKIQDLKSPVGTPCEKSIFSSDCPVITRGHTASHSSFGTSAHWLQSLGKGKDDLQNGPRDPKTGIHDVFSETQTESQLVGYEEDLSGRQMIIDRVRSSMT